MRVHFQNNHPSRVWVAIIKYNPDDCPGDLGRWVKQGWWEVDHGEDVWAFSTTNRYAAAYAIAEDGTEWSGSYGPVCVPDHAFDECINISGATINGEMTLLCDYVGMRLIDLGRWHWMRRASYTVTFVD